MRYARTLQQPFKAPFGEIPVFDLTKERLEKIDPADYQTIQELVQNTQKGFEQLLEAMDLAKCPKAKTYLYNLYHHTMTFVVIKQMNMIFSSTFY